jgi:hypothetical protein
MAPVFKLSSRSSSPFSTMSLFSDSPRRLPDDEDPFEELVTQPIHRQENTDENDEQKRNEQNEGGNGVVGGGVKKAEDDDNDEKAAKDETISNASSDTSRNLFPLTNAAVKSSIDWNHIFAEDYQNTPPVNIFLKVPETLGLGQTTTRFDGMFIFSAN